MVDKVIHADAETIDAMEWVIAAAKNVRKQHTPDPEHTAGMGWAYPGAEYDRIDPVCQTCGTPDEYGVPWPCKTYAVLDVVLKPFLTDKEKANGRD